MPWSPVAKFFAAAATLGVGYLIFFRKPKPKPKPRPEGVPPGVVVPIPTPEGAPPPSPPPMPEGVAPFPGAGPPNWQQIFNDGVMAMIEEGRSKPAVRTGADMRYYVGSRLFPQAAWPLPEAAPPWQKQVSDETSRILNDLANVEMWPFHGTKEAVDGAVTFWISAHKMTEICRGQGLMPDAFRLCAARRTYPDLVWPPPDDARPWQREAWDKFGRMLAV